MFLISTLPGRLAIGLVALIAALGAGWYFFVREDNQAQVEAASVTDAVREAADAQIGTSAGTATPASGRPVNTPAPTAASGAGAAGSVSTIEGTGYRLVENQSSAWYLAPEKLARLSTSSTAKGTTKGVAGEFHFANGGLDPAKATTFTVDLTKLASDEGMRDRRVQTALATSRYPTATFTATSLSGLPAEFGSTDSVMHLTGTLDLHGVQRGVTWELKVKEDGGILSGLATVKLKYADFNITKPDVGGFVTVEDALTIQVQLFAAPA